MVADGTIGRSIYRYPRLLSFEDYFPTSLDLTSVRWLRILLEHGPLSHNLRSLT